MKRLTERHKVLVRRAREIYKDIYPCLSNHVRGFHLYDEELVFFFNTADNSTHVIRESRPTAAERIVQGCLN